MFVRSKIVTCDVTFCKAAGVMFVCMGCGLRKNPFFHNNVLSFRIMSLYHILKKHRPYSLDGLDVNPKLHKFGPLEQKHIFVNY